MTSISSLGSAVSQYTSSLSSLDKNGDGIISADELAAADTTTKSTAKSSTSASDGDADNSAKLTQKIAADIMSLMLQMRQSDDRSDGDGSESKGLLASLDQNGDGRLTTSELLSADTSSVSDGSSDASNPVLAKLLTDMQTAIKAYQSSGGSADDTETTETQA